MGVEGRVLGADADGRRRIGGLGGTTGSARIGAAGASDIDAAPACSAAVSSDTDCRLG